MKVLVIGELCNDEYVYCKVDRVSPEAPVPVADIVRVNKMDGMAGNVANNLRAFDIEIDCHHNSRKQSIRKVRYVDEKTGQHLLRVDTTHPNIDPFDVTSVSSQLDQYNVIVISDYNKGFVTYKTVQQLRTLFKGPILIDSKKDDLGQFEGCIVKINEDEYNKAKSLPRSVIVTLGSKGAKYDNRVYASPSVKMFDVCGAGDTFLAGLTYKILQGEPIGPCIEYANKCAGVAVQQRGTYTLCKSDIQSL
tara:strand:+ start:18 stop:764 length:747 start_codon:yes stop_codon:yes gene_type:complete